MVPTSPRFGSSRTVPCTSSVPSVVARLALNTTRDHRHPPLGGSPTYDDAVRHDVVNGDRWISDRLAFLHDLLNADISDEQRTFVEAEIAVLSKESGITTSGRRRPRLLRRWRAR
jgi:hypothetical protein